MDAYISENNSMRLCDLIISGTHVLYDKLISDEYKNKLTLDKIPDKLAFCECKNCKSCTLCEKFMRDYLPKDASADKFIFNFLVKS